MGLKSLHQAGELPKPLEGSKELLELLPDEQLNEENESEIFTPPSTEEREKESTGQGLRKTLNYKNTIDLDDINIPEQVFKNTFRLIDEMSDSEIFNSYISLTILITLMLNEGKKFKNRL